MAARGAAGVARSVPPSIGVRGALVPPVRAPGGQSARVADIQRSRLVAAAVRAVDELGWANTTVADIVARSRISRRTFDETFANREDCLPRCWRTSSTWSRGSSRTLALRVWGGVSGCAGACG